MPFALPEFFLRRRPATTSTFRSTRSKTLCVAALLSLAACSGKDATPGSTVAPGAGGGGGAVGGAGAAGTAPSAGGTSASGGTLSLGGLETGGSGGAPETAGTSAVIVETLPPGFTGTELGGFELGDPIMDGAAGGMGPIDNGACGNILLGVVRDFRGADEPDGHPDFEAKIAGSGVTPGLVKEQLGADQKPVYASRCELGAAMLDLATCPYDAQTTTEASFDQWYRNTDKVNAPYLISIFLEPQPDGLFSFESLHYFPVDDAGFKSTGKEYTGELHNFGFTTELHTQFRYRGAEKFTFQGDDDVWVFINGKLAVDLGGLHSMQRSTIDLDQEASQLGLVKGMVYSLDLFHAERHTDASTFRIDTNLTFVDCGTVVPEPPPK